jgi:predicted AlkP superfamily phosphohydrolase/phosphomutase
MTVGRRPWWALVALTAIVASGCAPRHVKTGRRVIVLGIDGLDYELVSDLIARGRMPNFARLAQAGSFAPLATSTPPQSPVAWSSFMTGLDPGQHGIFDFIHRDAKTMEPFLSTTRTVGDSWKISLGRWQFPLRAGRVDQLRRGVPFWDVLERHRIETTIVRMPANFPPSGKAAREISGMGTPDMLGTYGTFSFFTSRPGPVHREVLSGGIAAPVDVVDGVVRGTIDGPLNPYYREPQKTGIDFVAYLDQRNEYVKLAIGGEQRLLHVGEWSDWVPVTVGLLPFNSLAGECRFYLKQIAPYFELYVSPINIDPLDPALPISTPFRYAPDLARSTGRFYTQGIPEDTKGLQAGVLSPDQFLEQAHLVAAEHLQEYRTVVDEFSDGFLFFYFGHIDQVSHMMWRAMDTQHPAYSAADAPYRMVVEDLYVGVDRLVGETLTRLASGDLLVVMSDHGFTSWGRTFSLNAWLRENGFLAVRDPTADTETGVFSNIDWNHTRAYGLGLNGLYLNVRGREAHGIVAPEDRAELAAAIARKLEQAIDPEMGTPLVRRAFRREDVYHLRDVDDIAPDLIVGYAKGVRNSDESALGAVPRDVVTTNRDAWNGDHCIDPELVPGILLTSRPLRRPARSLETLAGALLAEFEIDRFPEGGETKP